MFVHIELGCYLVYLPFDSLLFCLLKLSCLPVITIRGRCVGAKSVKLYFEMLFVGCHCFVSGSQVYVQVSLLT